MVSKSVAQFSLLRSTFGNAGNTFTPFNAVSFTSLLTALLALMPCLQSEAILSKEAIAYWTSFGATGDPSTDKESTSPTWEPFVGPDGTRRHMILTRGGDTVTNSTMGDFTAAKIQRCQFWMSENVTAQTRI